MRSRFDLLHPRSLTLTKSSLAVHSENRPRPGQLLLELSELIHSFFILMKNTERFQEIVHIFFRDNLFLYDCGHYFEKLTNQTETSVLLDSALSSLTDFWCENATVTGVIGVYRES